VKQNAELPEIGKDEMNLVEFPITLLAKRRGPGKNTIKFSDTITGAGGLPVKREWTVTGTEEYGLPLAQDNDVLLALMAIGKEKNFSSRKIYFSRYRLLEIMGWCDEGRSYKRIEEALKRFLGVGIYAKNAFWDNERKSYVTLGFGIIDSFALYDSHNPAKQPGLPLNSVTLGEELFESIQAGYIKSLDMKTYFGFESAVSKRLYRYLDKKAYNKKKFEIGLFILAEAHLGLQKTKYASHIKEKLSPAHEELLKAGFLKLAEYQKTSDGSSEKVVYHFRQRVELAEPCQASGPCDQAPALDAELLARLIEIGVTKKIAEQILLEYPLEAVRAQIDALPHRKAEDAPAALVSSIMNDWSLPASHKKQKQSLARAEAEKKQREQEKQQKAEHRTSIEEYLSALAGEELAELTRQALDLARQEYGTLFPGKEIPDYQVTGYLHILVEKRLKGAL
jgi:hypothetical protein